MPDPSDEVWTMDLDRCDALAVELADELGEDLGDALMVFYESLVRGLAWLQDWQEPAGHHHRIP